MRMLPRNVVGQDRFSMSLMPCTIRFAQGWRMEMAGKERAEDVLLEKASVLLEKNPET
jgi:hypothetical protein